MPCRFFTLYPKWYGANPALGTLLNLIMAELKPNEGKNLTILIRETNYARFPIKTHIISADDEIEKIASDYAKEHLQDGDILFISEKIVAISQGRAFPIKDIKPSKLAKLLVKYVHKSPCGIGLGSPWTMELAIKEVGKTKIVLAAFVAAITKPLGVKGLFYKIVGNNINAIDGPCDYTLPPYNEYAKLGPLNPHKVAGKISKNLNIDVVIIDANDLGVNVLGKSNKKIENKFYEDLFKDNPLGQTKEQTPLCIVRKV